MHHDDVQTAQLAIHRCPHAWDRLFAHGDALRARARYLFPGNPQAQESAVLEFWGDLLIDGLLAKYDGTAPLGPWLTRVFVHRQHNAARKRHIRRGGVSYPREVHVGNITPPVAPETTPESYYAIAARAARDWVTAADDQTVRSLLLRAPVGTPGRAVYAARGELLAAVRRALEAAGWDGDDPRPLVDPELYAILKEYRHANVRIDCTD